MPGARWTAAEECYVILNRRRLRVATLARHLGRSERAIVRWCERNRVYPTTGAWYTSSQAARLTDLSPQYLTGLARARRIRARRVPGGRWWLFAPEAVEALCRERRPELWRQWARGAPGGRAGRGPRALTEHEVRRAG